MARWTKKDDCKFFAAAARRLKQDAEDMGLSDAAEAASFADSDFGNAHECLLSSTVEDKRCGGGGSSAGWALRREAAGLMKNGHKRLAEARAALTTDKGAAS